MAGLILLNDPKDAVIDIVFVHGLQGHHENTWTWELSKRDSQQSPSPSHFRLFTKLKRSVRGRSATENEGGNGERESVAQHRAVFWPRDLLMKDFPKARILMFGYNTVVTQGYEAANQGNIFAHARNLLYGLEAKRRAAPNRDLVFIAHSLGGILVKEVLRRSDVDPDMKLKKIFQLTTGIFFLGTPHRGSRDWASFGEGVSKIASLLVGVDVNQQVIHALLPTGPELEICRESFTVQWVQQGNKLTVRTFQESKGVTGIRWGGFNKLIVPPDSSTLDHPNQHARTIDADHMEMCKFSGKDDPAYVMIKEDIEELVLQAEERGPNQNAEFLTAVAPLISGSTLDHHDRVKFAASTSSMAKSELESYLASLWFPEMDFRRNEIDVPLPETGRWIFAHEYYLEWIEQRNLETYQGLLWIKGKPGAGKSTLMKEAFRRCKVDQDRQKAVTASFFFHARGNVELQIKPLGLFRSIWHQLLSQDQALQHAFLERFRPKYNKLGKHWDWDENELKDAFRGNLTAHNKRIILFVDGLDECVESEIRNLVSFFRKATKLAYSKGNHLSICLSSRHYPLITVDHCPEIVVENGNSEDINLYVATELFPTDQTEMHQEIRQEVVQKANSVFLWVVLVIQILSEESDSGEASNVKWMQQRLHSVPGRLEELFQDLVKKIKPSNLQATVFLIQMVLFAIRPVKVNEMCQCLGLKIEGYKSLKDWEQCMTYTNDMEAFKRRIRFLSRGLIDVTATGMTQFIHQSVVDFFLNHNGLFFLDSTLESNAIGKSHGSIIAVSLRCVAIEEINLFSGIDTPEVERILGRKQNADRYVSKRAQMSKRYNDIWDASELFPFLWYVTECLLIHFSAAERANVTPTSALQQFLQSENLLWQRFKDSTILRHLNILTKPLYPHTVLYSFVMQGLEDCVRALISMGANVNEESEPGSSQFPLHAAASINDQKLLEALIEAGATIGIKDRSGRTVLHLFAMQNNESAIQKILSCGLDVNTVDRNKQTALHHSVRNSIPQVRQVEPTTYRRENVLSCMSQSSHSRLSVLLMEHGADVDSRDADKGTPLHWAVMRSDVAHVALLLEHKADPNIEDFNGEAPIHVAVQRRHSSIVNLLVDYGANVNVCDSDGMTPSQLAIEARDIEMVRLLEMKGAAGASELIKLFEEKGDFFLLNGSGQPIPIMEEPNPFANVSVDKAYCDGSRTLPAMSLDTTGVAELPHRVTAPLNEPDLKSLCF